MAGNEKGGKRGQKGVDQKRYDIQERGGGRNEVGKQRVEVRGVGREEKEKRKCMGYVLTCDMASKSKP